MKLHFWQFSQFKNWFLAIFEIAKNGIWSKNLFVKLIYIWFHDFFGLDFFYIFWPTVWFTNCIFKFSRSFCSSKATYSWVNTGIDLEGWTLGGPGGGGARRFLVAERAAPVAPEALVKVLMAAGEVGRSPGLAQPDPELMLLSPALCKDKRKR